MMQWLRDRKHRRALAARQKRLEEARRGTELREFVYLDETSVYSLVASRLGPIATEQTDSTAASWESQAAGKMGLDLVAFDVESSAQLTHARSQGSQVLRKSVIQTTFKDLLEMERKELLLSSASGGGHERKKNVICASSLKRGDLIEVEVELGVEDVFRVVTVISSMMGMIENGTGVLPTELLKNASQGRAAEGILKALLTGLVPIRARVLDHEVHEKGGESFLKPVSAKKSTEGCSVYLVGVAEERLFWKDMRRVLFSNGRYKVLARLGQDGLSASWTPVKLAHVVENFIPNFSTQITEGFWRGMTSDSQTMPRSLGKEEVALGTVLCAFGNCLAERFGPAAIPKTLEGLRTEASALEQESFDFDKYREICGRFASEASRECGTAISASELSALRTQAREGIAPAAEAQAAIASPVGRDLFLDCEIVAIYW